MGRRGGERGKEGDGTDTRVMRTRDRGAGNGAAELVPHGNQWPIAAGRRARTGFVVSRDGVGGNHVVIGSQQLEMAGDGVETRLGCGSDAEDSGGAGVDLRAAGVVDEVGVEAGGAGAGVQGQEVGQGGGLQGDFGLAVGFPAGEAGGRGEGGFVAGEGGVRALGGDFAFGHAEVGAHDEDELGLFGGVGGGGGVVVIGAVVVIAGVGVIVAVGIGGRTGRGVTQGGSGAQQTEGVGLAEEVAGEGGDDGDGQDDGDDRGGRGHGRGWSGGTKGEGEDG